MPTINQLVRKGRKTTTTKSTAPALQKGFNSKLNRQTNHRAPQKRPINHTNPLEPHPTQNKKSKPIIHTNPKSR